MSEIKISDRLLSWVLGCECEFKGIVIDDIIIRVKNLGNLLKLSNNILEKLEIESFNHGRSINLHTFIHLLEEKIFDKNYLVSTIMDGFVVFDIISGEPLKQVGKGEVHRLGKVEQKLEAFEWVAEKVWGEK